MSDVSLASLPSAKVPEPPQDLPNTALPIAMLHLQSQGPPKESRDQCALTTCLPRKSQALKPLLWQDCMRQAASCSGCAPGGRQVSTAPDQDACAVLRAEPWRPRRRQPW